MAGIWESPDDDNEPPRFSILTTKANELAAEVHDRMPVILPIGAEHQWLTQAGYGVRHLFPFTYPADEMRSYPVTPKMNKASFNEPDAILPLERIIA
jgi:putative SOS response-associated peptidase YedK